MERRGLAVFGFVLSAALGLPEACAEPWRAIGPGGGGAQFRPSLSPHDPRLVVVGTDMNAGFVSEDQGASWRRFHLRSRLKTVLFDAVDRDAISVLLPGTLGLYRSGDRGRTWRLVYPPPASVERLVHQDDEAEIVVVTRGGPGLGQWEPIDAIDADPSRAGAFYGVRGRRLEVSHDGGATWRAVSAETLGQAPIEGTGRSLFVDPAAPEGARRVAVVSPASVYFFTPGARLHASAPPGTGAIREAGFGAGPGGGLYVITSPLGLWVTRDWGGSWQRLPVPESANSNFRGLAVAARGGENLYLSFSGLAGWFSKLHGVMRSADGGRNWSRVWLDAPWWPDGRVDANGWIKAALGAGWAEHPLEIGVHPGNPELVFTTDFGRTLRSTRGGAPWEATYTRPGPGGDGWVSTGLDVTTTYGVHFDPFDARRMFISYTDIGIFRSDNGGASWHPSGRGIPREWSNSTYWVAFDPEARGRAWAATSGVHDLPRMKMVRRWQPALGGWHGGVCASRDGGRTWAASSRGLPDLPVTHLLVDTRASRPGKRTLYAAVLGGGLYRSVDDGETWSARMQGIEQSGVRPLVWRVEQDAAGTLYAVVTRRSESLAFGNPETDGAIYRSRDQGGSWQRLPLPPGLNGPHGIAFDPRDASRLYVAAFGRFEPGALTRPLQGGVHVSADGGRTWRATLTADQYVYDVAVDPAAPDVVYASGYESSLWRSEDRGERWRRVPGFNVKNAHRVIPDPRRPGWVYVASYGSSVWHGPGTGDPESREDIVTPEVAYGRGSGR